jgi:hypothetical protein
MTLKTKVWIGVGIVVLAIVILFATGIFQVTLTRVDESGSASAPTTSATKSSSKQGSSQQAKLNTKAISFADKEGLGTFEIKLPVGWSLGDDAQIDFLARSMAPLKLSTGADFYPNLNIVVGKHDSATQTFADYETTWKSQLMAQFPGMEAVKDGSIKVNGMDTYVLEITQAAPDGTVVHQIQYLYYVDQQVVAVATGTVTDAAWDDFEKVINDSLKSFQKTTDTSSI